jgi:UDP-N-acetylmuramoyl-tripeptide--D-alanyl-D-alanine ligase
VGVTGSAGKTTTVALTTHVLANRYTSNRQPADAARPRGNVLPAVARRILTLPPGRRFLVVEVAASSRGRVVADSARILRPDISVVTNVGLDHFRVLRTLDGVAAEKQSLIAQLAPGGTAVLNADDPRVDEMRGACSGRVVTFGTGEGAEVRAHDVRGAWPGRLSFTATQGESPSKSRPASSDDIGSRASWRHWRLGSPKGSPWPRARGRSRAWSRSPVG